MTSNISTKVVRLDLKTILENYTNPRFWKKQWTIYKHRDFEIYAYIDSIYPAYGRLFIKIASKGPIHYGRSKTIIARVLDSQILVAYDNPEFTETVFRNEIENKCLEQIEYKESDAISNYYEYKAAEDLENDYKENIICVADERLDELNIKDQDVRNAYEKKCIDNADIPDYTGQVRKNMKHTVIPSEYLLCASWFDDKKKFDDLCEACAKTRKSIKIKIWLASQKVNSQEFVDNLKAELADI